MSGLCVKGVCGVICELVGRVLSDCKELSGGETTVAGADSEESALVGTESEGWLADGVSDGLVSYGAEISARSGNLLVFG